MRSVITFEELRSRALRLVRQVEDQTCSHLTKSSWSAIEKTLPVLQKVKRGTCLALRRLRRVPLARQLQRRTGFVFRRIKLFAARMSRHLNLTKAKALPSGAHEGTFMVPCPP